MDKEQYIACGGLGITGVEIDEWSTFFLVYNS